ncbi:MAG: hypothetical protein ACLQFR_19530 [Streptosporangiaceae bacterium]
MVLGTYRDLFAAIAGSAATLAGLLFVAVSVVPRRGTGSGLNVIQQVRAAAAMIAFSNALAVSLFGLVPGTNVGIPAVVLGLSASCSPPRGYGPSGPAGRRCARSGSSST